MYNVEVELAGPVNHSSNVVEDVIGLTVDLKTAKYLKQREADRIRLTEHRKQKPLVWERSVQNGLVRWIGTIDGAIYAVLFKE